MMLKGDARTISLLPRQPVGSLLAGRHASRLRGRGLAFEELRQYHMGDDIRTIDWRATARLRTPQVRVYTQERDRPVLLVVDQRQTMFFGSRRTMKSVAAAELAALGAWSSLEGGDQVGGLVFNDSDVVDVRPHRSRNRMLQLLNQIVRLNHDLAAPPPEVPMRKQVTLNDALRRTVQITKHDYLVVLISDLVGADDETKCLATRLAAHNDMIVAAVYDPLGASLVGSPGMLASDQGQIWEIDGGSTFTRDFKKAFQRKLDRWHNIFQALRVPVLPISTYHSVPDQVRSLLGRRQTTS